MAISESTDFTFNGISSQSMGVMNVHINNGLYQEPFTSTLELFETKVKRKNRPLFSLLKKNPLSFKVTFSIPDISDSAISAIKRWLVVSYYTPLIFSSSPTKIYFCLPINDIKISHNGTQGYIEIDFRCDDHCAFSSVNTTQIYDLTTNPTSTIIPITNSGDLEIYPVLYVQIMSGSTFSITNTSNANQLMSFTGLSVNETVTISGDDQSVTSSLPLVYRYNAMSGDFTTLIRGINNLSITGNVKIQFSQEWKLL